MTRKTFNFNEKRIDIKQSVAIFDQKGYEQFKKFKPADIDEAELIHDPRLLKDEELKPAKREKPINK